MSNNVPSVTTTDLPLSVFQVSKDYRRLQHVDANGYIVYPKLRGLVARSRTVNLVTGTGAVVITARQLVEGIVRLTDPLTTSVTLPSAQAIVRYLQRLYGIDPRVVPASFEWSAEVLFENRTAAPITLTGSATVLLPNGLTSDTIGIGASALELFVVAAGSAPSVRFDAIYGSSTAVLPPRSAFTAITPRVENVDEAIIFDESDSYNPYRATREQIVRNSTIAGSTFLSARSTAQAAAATGGNNTVVGVDAGDAMTTGSGNTLFGSRAGAAITVATNSVFIGVTAGESVTATTGNIGIGAAAMPSATSSVNSIAIGSNAMTSLTGGNTNTGVGASVLTEITTGTGNTAIGSQAGRGAAANVDGGTFIGNTAGLGTGVGSFNLNNVTCLGNTAAGTAVPAAANTLYFNSGIVAIAAAADMQYDAATGRAAPLASSIFYKHKVQQSDLKPETIDALVPRSFYWRNPSIDSNGDIVYDEDHKRKLYGFIAEEAAEASEAFVVRGDHKVYSEKTRKVEVIESGAAVALNKDALIHQLVVSVQDLRRRIAELEAKQ